MRNLLNNNQEYAREDKFKEDLMKYLNIILGKQETSVEFWTAEIKEQLDQKFPNCLTVEEKSQKFNLSESINKSALIQRLSVVTGFKLEPTVIRAIEENPKDPLELVSADILSLPEKTKHMYEILPDLTLFLTGI
jgi:hypothetical protein